MDIMAMSGGKKDPTLMHQQSRLDLVSSVKFQAKVEHFSWSPKTFISTLKPSINFVISDNTQSLTFCTTSTSNLVHDNNTSRMADPDVMTNNVKTKVYIEFFWIYDLINFSIISLFERRRNLRSNVFMGYRSIIRTVS